MNKRKPPEKNDLLSSYGFFSTCLLSPFERNKRQGQTQQKITHRTRDLQVEYYSMLLSDTYNMSSIEEESFETFNFP